jgi:hypothetical protein
VTETPISPRVKRLVRALGSARAIEILLFLVRISSRSLSASELARELRVGADLEPTLEHLATLNLLDVHLGATLRYRLAPATPELTDTVRELASEYDTRRLAILEILEPRSSIDEFADAFRLRRRKGHE